MYSKDPENPLPVPVTSLHFSTTFGRLLVGCEDGDCFALDLGPDDNPVLEFKVGEQSMLIHHCCQICGDMLKALNVVFELMI